MNRIKQLRLEKGLKQIDIAKMLNITQATFSGWENGKYEIDNTNLLKLAEFFNCSVDFILGNSDQKSPGVEPELTSDTIEYALYGEARELDEDEKKQLLELAKLMRRKRKEAEKQ